MSIEAVKWALQQAPPCKSPGETLVLVYLAERADQYGNNAFPSKSTIAQHLFGSFLPQPPPGASKEEKAPYTRDKEAKERKVQVALSRLRESGHITVIADCSHPKWLGIPFDKKPTPYRLNMGMVREQTEGTNTYPGEGTNMSPRRGDENIPGGEIPPRRGDKYVQGEGTNTYPKPSVEPSGKPSGEGEGLQKLLQNVQPPPTPPQFENSLDQKPIPQEWINNFGVMEYCHDRHPHGNEDGEACRGCRKMKEQIANRVERTKQQNAEQQRLREEQRRNGKDKCNICNAQGRRLVINPNTGMSLDVDCLHSDIDRHEHIAALEFEGKYEEAQRLRGLTSVQAS